jgi:rhodanese-related sulfurtransferase
VQIHPGELLDLMHNDQLKLIILDMRSEVDYNLFHIVDSRRVALADMEQLAHTLIAEPANTVTVLVSNDEAHSTEAWKVLMAQSVPNVYILEGGINCWLDIFGYQEHIGCYTEAVPGNDTLRHIFTAAVGANQPAAEPDPHNIELEYTPKIKLEMKKAPSGGGCG